MKKDYQSFYAWLTAPFRAHPWLINLLKLANRLIEIVMYASYVLILVGLSVANYPAGWRRVVAVLAPFILIPGGSFILVSIVRHYLHASRPYEQWELTPLIAREKKGDSLPSRHVFSAAMIAMCALKISTVWGSVYLLLAIILAVIRVAGGVHYPRDVAVGLVIGVVAGCLLFV